MVPATVQTLLSSTLGELINRDYVLLDCPYFRNVGDILLWHAALDLLATIPAKCRYSSSIESFMPRRVPKDAIIVLTGGGNFGDLWPKHQEFRHLILKLFPSHKIVQLPQSVCFEDERNLKDDIEHFRMHKGEIVICLRDEQSYNIINKNYPFVETRLLPDLALCFEVEKFCKKKHIHIIQGERTLLLQRKDKENKDTSIAIVPDNISDWPCMQTEPPPFTRYKKIMEFLERRQVKKRYQKIFSDLYWNHILKDVILCNGISFLLPFRTVVSTRLHGGILAALLGKEVVLKDNSYGKCSGVYNLWMGEWTNVRMT